MVMMSLIKSIADIETHLHDIHATLQLATSRKYVPKAGLTWNSDAPSALPGPFALELREVFVHPSQVIIGNSKYIIDHLTV